MVREMEAAAEGGIAVIERPPTTAVPAPVGARASVPEAGARELGLRVVAFLTRDAVRVPLTVFLLSRVYVFLLGAIAMQIDMALPPVAALGYYMPEMPGLAHYLLQPWRNWDGHWYALIAQQGYFERTRRTAFFPLYPLLLRGVTWLLDGQIELAGVADLQCGAARRALSSSIGWCSSISRARSRGARCSISRSSRPPIISARSTANRSSCSSRSAALYAARRDRWWLAGAARLPGRADAQPGILLLLPLAILFVRQQGWRPLRWRANPISIALVPAGLMVYMVYLRRSGTIRW